MELEVEHKLYFFTFDSLLLLLMSCSTHSTCGVLCTVLFGGVCAATLTF